MLDLLKAAKLAIEEALAEAMALDDSVCCMYLEDALEDIDEALTSCRPE